MSTSRALLVGADSAVLESTQARDALFWLAIRESLPPVQFIAAISALEHETSLGRYALEDWLAKVLELSGYAHLPQAQQVRLLSQASKAFERRLRYHEGLSELLELCQPPTWARGIVSSIGFLGRDALIRRLPEFDAYGFACDYWRWNKYVNAHALLHLARRLQRLRPDLTLGRMVALEDDHRSAKQALRDGVGTAIVVLHKGGVARQALESGLMSREELFATGVVVVDDLQGAKEYLASLL